MPNLFPKKRITISEWAARCGIKRMDAVNLARRGKLPTAKLEPIAFRWTVDENEEYPKR